MTSERICKRIPINQEKGIIADLMKGGITYKEIGIRNTIDKKCPGPNTISKIKKYLKDNPDFKEKQEGMINPLDLSIRAAIHSESIQEEIDSIDNDIDSIDNDIDSIDNSDIDSIDEFYKKEAAGFVRSGIPSDMVDSLLEHIGILDKAMESLISMRMKTIPKPGDERFKYYFDCIYVQRLLQGMKIYSD